MTENQVPASMPTQPLVDTTGYISPEMLAQFKERARTQAMQAAMAQPVTPQPTSRVVYIRRNLTVAELIVVFLISCGVVLGMQGGWHLINNLPRIEVRWSK